ncbi:extracellular solute-binding protein [Paenibacillus alginolyticus]|uniref:extracellular solute-binding protein n=1 Tax=Paenibacillus alginolyticus TaxID=59839 RepID=UPI001FCA7B2D|nr:extracellular solute-binding protein [Paenibacillus alginolyticus]MCY9667465.1 extracellular solute-binding protein [Paenibacillus alginolyticus]
MKKTKSALSLAMVMAMAATSIACGSGGDTKTASSSTAPASAAPAASVKPAETAKPKEFKMVLRHIEIKDTAKANLAILQDVVKATEAEIPGLKFELDGVEDVVNRDTKLKAEMQAGSPPPIFDLFGGADTQNYSKAGRLLDLTRFSLSLD